MGRDEKKSKGILTDAQEAIDRAEAERRGQEEKKKDE